MSTSILALEISSQGVKAALYDNKLQELGLEFEEAAALTPAAGESFEEPEDILGAVRRTIMRVLDETGADAKDIAAIGVCGEMAGIVGIQSDGTPITHYFPGADIRCAKYAAQMRKAAGEKLVQITGAPPMNGHGPKILWLKHDHPEIYDRVDKFVTGYAYAALSMCGLDASSAFMDWTCIPYSGFANAQKKEWSDDLLQMFGVDKDKMPKLVSPMETIGKVSADFAKETGLAQGTPVAAGIGSIPASVCGSGLAEKGRVLDMTGLSGTVIAMTDTYVPDPGSDAYIMIPTACDDRYLAVGCINGGALAMRWFADTLTGEPPADYTELDKEAANVVIGCDGVVFAPSGGTFPTDPDMRGSYLGLSWRTSRAHMYRAIIEGAAFGMRRVLGEMKKAYPEIDASSIYTSGGAAEGSVMKQIKAAVLDASIESYELTNCAPAGAAAMAGAAVGAAEKGILRGTRTPVGTTKPDAAAAAAYRKIAEARAGVAAELRSIYKGDDVCG